jgi:predicted alpha/beta-hydrolase family hydrolase
MGVQAAGLNTRHGLARVHRHEAQDPWAMLALGHAAGGSVAAPDLVAAREVALSLGVSVALVEQPYRVAGRRRPSPAPQLDEAWLAVCATLGGRPGGAGGRASGARVACRTADAVGAIAVLCLAFPLIPPWAPDKPRTEELESVRVPTLVVQGGRDQFGMPSPGPHREVVRVRGDHSLKSDLPAVRAAIRDWLASLRTAE